jgi:hypothetical protein
MGLTGQEERACVHDSMRMGWGRGGGDDGGWVHASLLPHACMHAQRTHVAPSLSLSHTHSYRYIFIYWNKTHLVRLGRPVCLDEVML